MERVSRQVQAYKQVHGFGFNLDWELYTIEMQDDTVQNRNPKVKSMWCKQGPKTNSDEPKKIIQARR